MDSFKSIEIEDTFAQRHSVGKFRLYHQPIIALCGSSVTISKLV